MASLCCDPRHRSASAWWQPAQVSLPMKVATEALDAFLGDPFKNWYPRLIATMIKAATGAAIQILCFDSRLDLGRGPCGGLVCGASAGLFLDRFVLADLDRLRVMVLVTSREAHLGKI